MAAIQRPTVTTLPKTRVATSSNTPAPDLHAPAPAPAPTPAPAPRTVCYLCDELTHRWMSATLVNDASASASAQLPIKLCPPCWCKLYLRREPNLAASANTGG